MTLTGQTARHVSTVLRLRAGDHVELKNGRGGQWRGEIARIEQGAVHIRVEEEQYSHRESPLILSLALAYSRSDPMDLVMRQATELGVHHFLALGAKRSQYNLSETQKRKKKERWLRIAREALCQCGRIQLPEISLLSDVSQCIKFAMDWEKEHNNLLKILALEKETSSNLIELWQETPECDRIMIVIGPEGGWTSHEAEQFKEAGFHTVCLGPRILRLETAATAFLTSAQLLWGDLSS
jgi:16S rRNA (uracil1498-N3)-methyltransferase